ncbi:unnamed protein product, partial [Symbiodinium necroappetens]
VLYVNQDHFGPNIVKQVTSFAQGAVEGYTNAARISPPSAALRGTAADIIVVGVRELYQHGWAADPMLQQVLLIGDAPAAEINFELLKEQRERRLQQERERCRQEAEARRQALADEQEVAEAAARRAAAEEAEALAKVVSGMDEPVSPDQAVLNMSASAAATGSREANCPWKTVDFSPEGDDPAMSDEANYQTLVPAHLLTGVDSDECKTLVPLPVALEFSSDLSPPREHAAAESPLSAQDFPGEVTCGQPVWLHVYDLTDSFQLPVLNSALRRAGAGLFHAGIEVHGYEYSFGLRQRGSGVYTSVPKKNTAHAQLGRRFNLQTSHNSATLYHALQVLVTSISYHVTSRTCYCLLKRLETALSSSDAQKSCQNPA